MPKYLSKTDIQQPVFQLEMHGRYWSEPRLTSVIVATSIEMNCSGEDALIGQLVVLHLAKIL